MRSLTILPLHNGKAPKWLFSRMVKLSGKIGEAIMDEYGVDEFVRRLSDSNWFQALACAIGYDWHSSGTTTVTIGALKEAFKYSKEIAIAGGKGKAGTNTPNDIIEKAADLSISSSAEEFIRISRLAAKVDSAMVYDDIGIYEHAFIFNKNKKWAVVQQAMQYNTSNAIRFQWFSEQVDLKDVANEPHTGISTSVHQTTLDLTYSQNEWARRGMPEAAQAYNEVVKQYPHRHEIMLSKDLTKRGIDAIERASEARDYKDLLLVKGIGRSTVRALALVASLIFDKELAYRDPVAFAYTLGGKDGIPFRINKRTYDSVIDEMTEIIDRANIENKDKYYALKRLSAYITTSEEAKQDSNKGG